jgi:hypothetical protein
MPRIVWPLRYDRPAIEVVLTQAANGQPLLRHLLADSGAGTTQSPYELLLEESDCLLCGGQLLPPPRSSFSGAYSGSITLYLLRVQIPPLGFDQPIHVAAVAVGVSGFDGLACFCFLNRFTYGNFGDPSQFGLET